MSLTERSVEGNLLEHGLLGVGSYLSILRAVHNNDRVVSSDAKSVEG